MSYRNLEPPGVPIHRLDLSVVISRVKIKVFNGQIKTKCKFPPFQVTNPGCDHGHAPGSNTTDCLTRPKGVNKNLR